MAKGYISMRNQDGTQWALLVDGVLCWGDYDERQAFPKEIFDQIEAGVEASRANDCPDNGFFGIYNLKFKEKE